MERVRAGGGPPDPLTGLTRRRRELLRRAGEEIFTQVLSGDLHRPREPWTHARLRSLVLDLRWVVQYLEEIAAEPLESHPDDRDEDRLAREAAGWAVEIDRVAERIENRLRRFR